MKREAPVRLSKWEQIAGLWFPLERGTEFTESSHAHSDFINSVKAQRKGRQKYNKIMRQNDSDDSV